MRMKQCSDKRCTRRGFSLVEVVVALAIIVIVSGAAISLIVSHSRLEARTVQTVEAASIAENAIECFRYANDGAEFIALMNEVYGTNRAYDPSNPTPYNITWNGCAAVISGYNTNTITIEITVLNSKDEEIIDKVTYTKVLGAVGGGT